MTILEIYALIYVPQLTSLQLLKSLATIKKTASGSNEIPFWVWQDYADELAPVVLHLWNLSLHMQTWPMVWKEANVDPLPKIDIPVKVSDYRGINVTPIIARAFEKVVYKYIGILVSFGIGNNVLF